ncbi:putative sex pilus assembly and mating pair protein TraG [Legionella busanensis]|uniref:Putative sex pilus assembly and mating pair protein TraG n=1 Tax=Legionella busanensis TaxID=190655 RepID=A0A378K8J8_9GAMM|nr:conjugal transfer protein TraG N-terminal domain-containing protein [Legionella busanensis]STX81268.1 putative sex pilus assembly and mating pair protein TraG [Legionella busanensis]
MSFGEAMLAIYTPQNGAYFKETLDAVASVMKTETFSDAIDSVLILAFCMAAFIFVKGNKVQALFRYILTTFFALYCLIGITVPVNIQDMQRPMDALTVDNVPIGIALPASIISRFGYAITVVFSDVFRTPADSDYIKSGMIFGSRTWLSSTSASFNGSPELSHDVSAFIRQCIFSAKLLGSRQISATELIQNKNLQELYLGDGSSKHSPIFRVIFRDGQNRSCTDAATNLRARINTAVDQELSALSRLMSNGDKSKYEEALEAAHKYYMGVSKTSAQILTQNMLINATRNAARDAFAFNGADADLMNYTNTASMQKMHIAEANSFWLASYRLPYYMTVFWMLTVCIFPLVFLISLFPTTQNVYKVYLQSQAYLWTWPPLFIIIHFFVSMASATTTNIFNQQTGGVSFSNIDSLANLQSYFAYTAGALAASVPFLAYYITKGLASVLSQAAQHFGGIAQSLSTSEAQSIAQGNVSMASYSGWNMNYDNTNAHKFDTNRSFAEGKITAQHDNGALISMLPNGTSVGNVQPAISSAVVGIHGSERVIDSLNQSAQQSFHNAEQHRVAADKHLHQAFSGLSQFNDATSIDTRNGAGLSKTESSSYHEDIRQMKDSVQQYNSHHDVSKHISLDQALTGKIDTGGSALGMIGKLASGVSVEASGSLRHGNQYSDNLQDFFNSSEGSAFSSAFNHMQTTAHNQHLDVSDSTSLSGSEQIAANISKGASLMSQASAEFSSGLNYQSAGAHAREDALSIDANFNQALHDYVAHRHGATGVDTMLRSDSASIQKQQAYAKEFINSEVGKSMISESVQSQLSTAKSAIYRQYQQNSNNIKSSTTSNIENSHQKNLSNVAQKIDGNGIGLTKLNQQTQSEIDTLMHGYQSSSVTDAFRQQESVTKDAINHQKDSLSSIHATQKKQSEHQG